MLLDIRIDINNELLEGVNKKDADEVAKALNKLLGNSKDMIVRSGMDSSYVVNTVNYEDIICAIESCIDKDMKRYFQEEDNFEQLCHQLKYKTDWGNIEEITYAMDYLYDFRD